MLHILNTAWMKILVNQSVKYADKSFLIVAATDEEKFDTVDELWSLLSGKSEVVDICVLSLEDLKLEIASCVYFNEDYPIYDDILISHDIKDIFIKDFLGRHCRRKGG